MGMFDDAAKRRATEAAARVHSDALRKAEQNQVARKVAEDLKGYIGTHPTLHNSFEVSVHENLVTARRKTTTSELKISAKDQNTFTVVSDVAQTVTADKAAMTDFVLDWLNTA